HETPPTTPDPHHPTKRRRREDPSAPPHDQDHIPGPGLTTLGDTAHHQLYLRHASLHDIGATLLPTRGPLPAATVHWLLVQQDPTYRRHFQEGLTLLAQNNFNRYLPQLHQYLTDHHIHPSTAHVWADAANAYHATLDNAALHHPDTRAQAHDLLTRHAAPLALPLDISHTDVTLGMLLDLRLHRVLHASHHPHSDPHTEIQAMLHELGL
ncbi:hypothetical protein, partial [Streptomyces viridochromogenes]